MLKMLVRLLKMCKKYIKIGSAISDATDFMWYILDF